MTEDQTKALLLAGKLASAANAVVYGASIYDISERIKALRTCLINYDDHILSMSRENNERPC